MKSAQTSKIGKKFQGEREALGLSEQDVSSRTLITIDFIRAIESGDYSIFPARMYALRYFEKYASFLQIQQEFFDIYDVNNHQEDGESNPSHFNSVTEAIKSGKYNFIISLISVLFFAGIVINGLHDFFSSSHEDWSMEESHVSKNIPENQLADISEIDRNFIANALEEIKPLFQPVINVSEVDSSSEFQVTAGELKKLSLSFTEDSWLEIYQGATQLIYRLFNKDERLDISITPPFKIIAGNANGVAGFYGESKINFTKVANELNVSFIEIEHE